MEGIGEFRQAPIVPCGGRRLPPGTSCPGFMRTLVIELLDEIIELGLLLQTIDTGRPCRFGL